MASYEIRLHNGRQIYLKELEQRLTYEGLLEGLPTRQMNARQLQAQTTPTNCFRVAFTPHLIEPEQEPLEWTRDRPYPFGDPAALPPVWCRGRFESFETARDPSQERSGLIIVWFQHEWALPVDAQVLERVKALNWNGIASDYER